MGSISGHYGLSPGSHAGHRFRDISSRIGNPGLDHRLDDVMQQNNNQGIEEVMVVFVNWEGQSGYAREHDEVARVADRLGWRHQKCTIESHGATFSVIEAILRYSNEDPDGCRQRVLLIQYGGHGSNNGLDLVSDPQGSTKADWNSVKFILQNQMKAHTVVVHDTCFVAFDGWATNEPGQGLEIVASAPHVSTPGPASARSFNLIFWKELEAAIDEQGHVTIPDLNNRLIASGKLVRASSYFNARPSQNAPISLARPKTGTSPAMVGTFITTDPLPASESRVGIMGSSTASLCASRLRVNIRGTAQLVTEILPRGQVAVHRDVPILGLRRSTKALMRDLVRDLGGRFLRKIENKVHRHLNLNRAT